MALRRLLVAGGTGFIGRHICYAALAEGYQVAALSLHPPTVPLSGVCYLRADLADIESLRRALDNAAFDYVINVGGYVDHRAYWAGGQQVIAAHLGGVTNLLKLLDRSMLKRYIHIGSSDEYGALPAPQREDMRENPISPYSWAKAATTQLLQMLWRTEHFPAVTLRLFLVYGREQGVQRFLPQIVRGCLLDARFPVSEGCQLRDFCHVGDIAQGVLAALKASDADGEVINLASGQPRSIRETIETLCRIAGSGTPEFGAIPYRAGENMALYADIGKARALLGWNPQIAFADGLADTIAGYRDSLRDA